MELSRRYASSDTTLTPSMWLVMYEAMGGMERLLRTSMAMSLTLTPLSKSRAMVSVVICSMRSSLS